MQAAKSIGLAIVLLLETCTIALYGRDFFREYMELCFGVSLAVTLYYFYGLMRTRMQKPVGRYTQQINEVEYEIEK